MFCPFQKITTNMNHYGRPISFGNELIVSTQENFNQCFKSKCAAWDEERQCCLLCRSCTFLKQKIILIVQEEFSDYEKVILRICW